MELEFGVKQTDKGAQVPNIMLGVVGEGEKQASQVAQWYRIHLQCRSHRRRGFSPWVGKIP